MCSVPQVGFADGVWPADRDERSEAAVEGLHFLDGAWGGGGGCSLSRAMSLLHAIGQTLQLICTA